jgi:polygalacturonase
MCSPTSTETQVKRSTPVTALIAGAVAGALMFSGAASAASLDAAAVEPPAVRLATGSGVDAVPEPAGPFFDITDFGAVAGGAAVPNQTAINDAIAAAAAAGGGTVVVPSGEFRTYTVRLRSDVGLHLAAGSVLRAAIAGTGEGGEGGFYDAPEVNLFVGLQDHGHSHWANSLVYGVDVDNVMISGPGLIDGGRVDEAGITTNVLTGGDPREVTVRTDAGVPGGANKAIALKNSTNITFRDFSLKNGGHFGIIGTGVIGWTIDDIVVDTNRDAIDIDASQDVTVRNSVFNSLTDDAIVLKASFGLGRFLPLQNVLIEGCTVSGYDAGSVLDRTYSAHKLVATDRDGPTARIKLGTEGTTGFNTVTIRDVEFDRSRGFAIETVDGADIHDIVLTDAVMRNVSSSPIFLRIGDRGRSPVTGRTTSESVNAVDDVRLDDRGWVLPNLPEKYGTYPATRYVPSYLKNTAVQIGGGSQIPIVNPETPTRLNPNSVAPDDPLFANAVGPGFATLRGVRISDVRIEDVDPRYPVLLAGLMDHPIEDVHISDVSITYRGGLTMEHAVEQRQLDQRWDYTAYQAAPATQSLPWLVNTFFAKNEALLPRVSWDVTADDGAGGWIPDPYNIPEMPREYPEPSNFGILPAYGIYARHVTGLTVERVTLSTQVEDGRPAVVLDDVRDSAFVDVAAETAAGVPAFVTVTNTMKRDPVREYVKDLPYRSTTVTGVTLPPGASTQHVLVDRPAPGTPPDSLYALPTAPSADHPYAYVVPNESYPKPLTVYRPTFDPVADPVVREDEPVALVVTARTPATEVPLEYSAEGLPRGATFDPAARELSWTPDGRQAGTYVVTFVVDDGVIPVRTDVTLTVLPAPPSVGNASGDLEAYVADGAVSGPIVQQLRNALRQADRHLAEGRAKPAVAALERALARLDDPKRGDRLGDAARADLTTQIQAVIDGLG